MRIAFIGSRDYPRRDMVESAVDYFQETVPGWILVSGGARGVDTWAELKAVGLGIATEIILADWSLGRGAGLLRNKEIIARADMVVAFWDGVSNGTRHGIGLARAQGKILWVINPII